jgi:hypothetical protein
VFTLCGVIATNNRALHEGGAVFRYGYPDESSVIDFTTLDGNFVDDPVGSSHAGGLYHHTDTPGVMPLFMRNSTVSNNVSATGAGGLFFFNSPVELTNVTVAGNVALGSLAGGIAASGVTGTLKNCTIADNHADDSDSFARRHHRRQRPHADQHHRGEQHRGQRVQPGLLHRGRRWREQQPPVSLRSRRAAKTIPRASPASCSPTLCSGRSRTTEARR